MQHKLSCTAAIRIVVFAAAFSSHAAVPASTANAATAEEAKCIFKMNKCGANVAKHSHTHIKTCLKLHEKGVEPSADACIVDTEDKKFLSKERCAIDTEAGSHCTPTAPPIGFEGADLLNREAIGQALGLLDDIFDDDQSDQDIHDNVDVQAIQEVKCQSKVAQTVGKLHASSVKLFNKCKKQGLKSGDISSSSDLGGCGASMKPPQGTDEKQDGKLKKVLDGGLCRSTTSETDEDKLERLLSGACSNLSANTLQMASCLNDLARCRACSLMMFADDLSASDIDCDEIDDGNTQNSSCVPQAAATTTTTTTTTSTTTSTTTTTTSTTTTSTTTTTLGGSLTTYKVVTYVEDEQNRVIGSLQYEIDYGGAGGNFEGSADQVVCTNLPQNSFGSFNDNDAEKVLVHAQVSTVGIQTPYFAAECDFSKFGSVAPGASDFSVTVTDAADNNLQTLDPPPTVSITVQSSP